MESSTDTSHRIPPSVFAPDTPTKHAEWSVASNESLFSIQMGMSFTRDQFLWRSGELGLSGVAPMASPTSNLTPIQSACNEVTTDGKSDEVGKPETTVDTREGVLGESEEQNHKKSHAEARISHYSVESITSEQSFAFPILTGHTDKEGSDSIGGRLRLSQEQQQLMSEPLPNQEKEPFKLSESKSHQAESLPEQTTWFSCFSCCTCTFCS